jgi:hypothetical protein
MSDPEEPSRPSDPAAAPPDGEVPADLDEAEAADIRALLRGAVSEREPPTVDVLHGVQRRIRQRTRGKYFDDGWSTTREPPISTYLVTSLVMLGIVVFLYFMLSPLTDEAATVQPPAPVHVLPSP